MITPPYPIPPARRQSDRDLARYVRHEFRESDSHWFSASSNGGTTRKVAVSYFFRGLFGRPRKRIEKTPDIRPAVIPCAVYLEQRCEDDKGFVRPRRN